MPEDRLKRLFEHIAQADVAVPLADGVLARGHQRRRRAWLRVTAVALTLVAAAGLGASELAGPETGQRPTTRSTTPGLPPSGSGKLILALDGTGRFVMARVGSAAALVRVPGLTAVAGGPSMLATDPRGGWVVTYSTDPGAAYGFQPARLALVTATGHSEPFGRVFRQSSVTSLAVSPDGSRVAIALLGSSGSSSGIEVRPTPGHRGAIRFWRIRPHEANDVVSLSWAPDGRRLSYIAGFQTGGGLAGGLETLDTALPGSVAPGLSPWSQASKASQAKSACTADAAAWLGTTGRLLALEECGDNLTGRGREIVVPVLPSTGRPAGPPLVIAHQLGCGSPGIAPAADGSRALISYCGLFIDDRGKLTKLTGLPPTVFAAAFAG